MVKAGRVDDAIRLLEVGLSVIPPEKALARLYGALSMADCR